MKFRIAILALTVAALSACGPSEQELKIRAAEVAASAAAQRAAARQAEIIANRPSFRSLEDARGTSSDNALYLAAKYRADNPRYDNSYKIVPHADVAITPDCPQGSGWANLSLIKVEGKEVDKTVLICSTYSQALGCYRDIEFVKKPFGGEEGKCQDPAKVPYPLARFK